MRAVGYLGPDGSYSELAARTLAPEAEKRAYPSFPLLFKALAAGECVGIVLPIENSLNGGVLQNIDLLQSADNVAAVKSCVLKIDNRLATLKGAKYGKITRIYSHCQALAQCGGYLSANFPQAELIAVPSTSAGAEAVKSFNDACIVGSHFANGNLSLSAENIADGKDNRTRFLLAVCGWKKLLGATERIYFSAVCPHRVGELYKLLEKIELAGLNMTKIESRPARDCGGNYRFFIEAEGDYSRPEVKEALKRVSQFAGSFKFLGGY